MPYRHQQESTKPSLLLAAHCLTIQRKNRRLDVIEFSAMLDDFVRELNANKLHSKACINSLDKILQTLNSTLPSVLFTIKAHRFFSLVCNTIEHFLKQINIHYCLSEHDTNVLRNSIHFLEHIVERTDDLSQHIHWLTDSTFLQTFGKCFQSVKKLERFDRTQHLTKRLTRLLHIFCRCQERLPIDQHRNLFQPLFQPAMNCLTSSTYAKIFRSMESSTKSLTRKEKFFLIKCPHFLTAYSGKYSSLTIFSNMYMFKYSFSRCLGSDVDESMRNALEILLPRYVSIFDRHMPTIATWNRPVMRAIHNIVITLIYAEGCFSFYADSRSFRLLINHLLSLLDQSTLLVKIHSSSNNIESLLIDATLVLFSVLVYEIETLDYIQQCKPIEIFRQLTFASRETIVLNAYVLFSYMIDEDYIRRSKEHFSQLTFNIVKLLQNSIDIFHRTDQHDRMKRENIHRDIIQLIDTLTGKSMLR
jgi:hypothetical protein